MQPEIKIGILEEPVASFSLNGTYLHKPSLKKVTGAGIARSVDNGTTIIMRERVLEGNAIHEFIPLNHDKDCFTLNDVTIGKEFHWQRKEEQAFKGRLMFLPGEATLKAINIIPVEDYLCSVISSEMNAMASLELLKAHAVISRSWLLSQIEKRYLPTTTNKENGYINDKEIRVKWYDREQHNDFDVCADDHCQRYHGTTRETTPAVKEAVKATSGIVLTFNNKICDARYSKCCGGITEMFHNTWEPLPHPYLTKIVDGASIPGGFEQDLKNEENAKEWIMGYPVVFCNTSDIGILSQVLNYHDLETKKFFRWQVRYSQEEIKSLLKIRGEIEIGDIIDLKPVERGESGRIIKLMINGTRGKITIGKELEIRRTLSSNHLYSSAFVVHKDDVKDEIPGYFTLSGAGWGHGVGLCQIGAAVMGAKGYEYRQILAHYFKGTELKDNYALPGM